MSAYRSPGHLEPTLTPDEEKKFYAAVPLFGAPVDVVLWMLLAVEVTSLVVIAAIVKTIYFS